MLDSKVKHYECKTYGMIDAIGTLGGVFEILYWLLILLYGSIRESMYLFSVINSLIQLNQNENIKSKGDNSKKIDAPMPINELGYIQKFNKSITSKRKIETNTRNRQHNKEASPILLKRQKTTANTMIDSDPEISTRKHPYSYSILVKS